MNGVLLDTWEQKFWQQTANLSSTRLLQGQYNLRRMGFIGRLKECQVPLHHMTTLQILIK